MQERRNHEQESFGDRNGLDKSTQQERVHAEALRRVQGDLPVIGGDVTPQSAVIRESALPVADATLNWASGSHVATVGRGDSPFTSELARVAGVGSGVDRLSQPAPDQFNHPVRPVPLAVESNSGRAMSSRDLFGGDK